MTILNTYEMDLEGQRSFYTSLSDGDVGKRTFRVITDSVSHTEPEIIAATGIPAPLSLFPGSTTSQCIQIQPIRDKKDGKKWLVTCDYKSILNQQELQRAANPDPLDRVTAISGQSRTLMIPSRRLLRTAPYQEWDESNAFTMGVSLNSATDPLDPPIEVAFTEWEIHCEKNVSVFPSWFLTYSNGVNNAAQNVTIRGTTIAIPKGCGKLGNFTFSPEKKENGTAFITISWNCIARVPRLMVGAETDTFSPWDEERLDEGLRTYNTSSGRWENVRDKSGTSVSLPVPFDGSGSPINSTGARIPESSLWWTAYRPYGDRVDYSVIPWS